MSTSINGQALLTLVENDALIAFGGPLLTFLNGVQAANGDAVKITAAWVQLQGNIVAAAPGALGSLESQLASSIAAKIVALQASTASKAAA